MKPKVYSAARANFPLRGIERNEAWSQLTEMFNVSSGRKHRTFIPGSYDLEPLKRTTPGKINVGDTFKYTTLHDSPMYVTVTEWNPPNSFAYEEQCRPLSGPYADKKSYAQMGKDMMRFELTDHPEGTLVDIERRKKGAPSLLNNIFRNSGQRAASDLAYIMTGNPSARSKITAGDVTIAQDNSLRRDF